MDITRLQALEERIIDTQKSGMRVRWEFGHELLKLRDGKKKLPNGLLTTITQQMNVSRAEINHRMRFAERHGTEAALSNALENHPTWHNMVQKGLTTKRRMPGSVEDEMRDTYVVKHLRNVIDVDPAHVRNHAAVASMLRDLLARYGHAAEQQHAA